MTKAKSPYRHRVVPSITFTDGAKYVADAAGAYWLLDEIALAQRHVKAVAAEEFQVWKLKVNADDTATLAMPKSHRPMRRSSGDRWWRGRGGTARCPPISINWRTNSAMTPCYAL